jgi:hypothetical protein
MNKSYRLVFKRRPSPVLADHRPLYKMGEVALILYLVSRAKRSSLPRLHLFNWALKMPGRVEALSQAARRKKLSMATWGFDPALAVALRYLCAENLVLEDDGKFTLLPAGEAFAVGIVSDSTAMLAVKGDLEIIGKGVTEEMVKAVAREWKVQ